MNDSIEKLIRYVMDDEEVISCGANTYQIAVIIATTLEFLRKQNEHSPT